MEPAPTPELVGADKDAQETYFSRLVCAKEQDGKITRKSKAPEAWLAEPIRGDFGRLGAERRMRVNQERGERLQFRQSLGLKSKRLRFACGFRRGVADDTAQSSDTSVA